MSGQTHDETTSSLEDHGMKMKGTQSRDRDLKRRQQTGQEESSQGEEAGTD